MTTSFIILITFTDVLSRHIPCICMARVRVIIYYNKTVLNVCARVTLIYVYTQWLARVIDLDTTGRRHIYCRYPSVGDHSLINSYYRAVQVMSLVRRSRHNADDTTPMAAAAAAKRETRRVRRMSVRFVDKCFSRPSATTLLLPGTHVGDGRNYEALHRNDATRDGRISLGLVTTRRLNTNVWKWSVRSFLHEEYRSSR